MKLTGWKTPLEQVNEEGLVEFCQQLLQIPSYTGQEQEAAQCLVGEMERLGFDKAWIDGVGNVIGEIKGAHPGPKVLFDGHIDTIPVSGRDKWTVDPFAGTIKDGYLYGRGACGMKGPLASMLYGLAPLAKHKERLAGSVYVSATVGVEQFEGLAFVQVVQTVKPTYVIIGEPSELQIKNGQRGRAELSVTTMGKAVHSAHASKGKNAAHRMMKLLEEIKRLPLPSQDELGAASIELTNIISAPYPGTSTVPHKCWATFDRYLLKGETEHQVLSPIYQAIQQLQQQDEDFSGEVEIVEDGLECYTGQYLSAKRFFPAWHLEEEHELVKGALEALRQIGANPAVSTYPFCTNGSYSAGVAGLPTIGFGPGDEAGMHTADEKIQLEQLFAAAAGYQAIACKFLLK